MKSADLTSAYPASMALWPSKSARDAQFCRLFGDPDSIRTGHPVDYKLADVRVAVAYRLLARTGLRFGLPNGQTVRLREAIEAAIWADDAVAFHFQRATIILEVPPVVWAEVAPMPLAVAS